MNIEHLTLFERGPVVLFKWRNAEGWPVEWTSPNAEKLTGYSVEEFLSGEVSYGENIHVDDQERVGAEVREALEAGVDSFEHEPYRIVRRDGSICWLHDVTHLIRLEGEVTHFIGYVLDITTTVQVSKRNLELEKQLLHTQKLESLGILAGGVAHDFNNLLTGILGEASLAGMALESPHGNPRRSIDKIETLALRAAELTRQLLAYSGKGRFIVQPLDLGELVREIGSILKVAVSKKAAMRFYLGHRSDRGASGGQLRRMDTPVHSARGAVL